MARRSDHTREALMALAIDAGRAHIVAHGHQQFSARAVAQAIGYTVGTLYNVFGDLDSFMLHIHAATLDAWHAHITAKLQENNGCPLEAMGLAYLHFAQENPELFHGLFEFRQREANTLPAWYQAKIDALFALLEQSWDGTTNHHQRAQMLWASVHGVCVLALSNKLDVRTPTDSETLVLALVRALKTA